ncbi:N-acetylmuramoyl-L-alanine amidase family protein [Bacillus paramycoides]|uniref:N-acetylmuramoyl-L-alanine amidase family protein n=1 Tax=Bacillus paramycoides TaxID=2026194 RepID=UPI003D08F266
MNERYKKRIQKVLPVGLAMGILFSSAPMTEYKVKADVDTFGTIVTTFGKVYDAFLAEPFGKWLEEIDVKTTYKASNENIAYKAPTFKNGEFSITVFDFYKNKDFSKKIKVTYPDGKVEYKTIKHGEQIRIKDAGTIVDLTPDEPELSKHDILYITQKQLDEGSTGVSLTNFKTYYLQSDNSGRKNFLADKFEKEAFPHVFLDSGQRDIRYVNEDLFSKLPEDKRMLATITANPVGKDVLSNYVQNDSEALADFEKRKIDVLAETKLILETPIALPSSTLNHGNSYQIIPYKKGSNKVFVKTGSKYLSGKEENKLQYSDSPGDDELFELVQIENDHSGTFQFRLNNKNGVSLAGNSYVHGFDTDGSFNSEIRFTAKSNNEINNWLIDWYPGKENEKPKYDGIQIITDEKDSTIAKYAKDSNGNVIKNSWIDTDGDDFYAGSDGNFLKGWQEIEGKTYYFDNRSHLFKDYSYPIDGKLYNINPDDGSLQRSAWRDDSYYSDASGAFVKDGLQKIDGKIYYFKGYSVNKNELRLEDQNIILHFSDKGILERITDLNGKALASPKVETLDGKKYCFNPDGTVLSIGWNDDGGRFGKYYLNDKGERVGGLNEIDGTLYYFAQEGDHFNFGTLVPDLTRIYYTDEKGATKRNFKGKVTSVTNYIDGVKHYLYLETDDTGHITVSDWVK